jgi:hypothetical protein
MLERPFTGLVSRGADTLCRMTMLYSLYPREGIVFVADSRIIRPGAARPEPPQPKVLRVRRVGVTTGLIGYYGLAEVRGQPMSKWLTTLIGQWPGSTDPKKFADLVVDGLNRDARPRERKQVSGLHFGAFRHSEGRIEPVFFHIINTHGFDETTGQHKDPRDTWRSEEQLMGRDVVNLGLPPARIRWYLGEVQRLRGMPYWYRNGDMPLFGPVTGFLEVAIAHVVRVRGYGAPRAISEWRVARVLVITTSQLARAFYRGAVPTIGDKARALSVEWPRSGL